MELARLGSFQLSRKACDKGSWLLTLMSLLQMLLVLVVAAL